MALNGMHVDLSQAQMMEASALAMSDAELGSTITTLVQHLQAIHTRLNLLEYERLGNSTHWDGRYSGGTTPMVLLGTPRVVAHPRRGADPRAAQSRRPYAHQSAPGCPWPWEL